MPSDIANDVLQKTMFQALSPTEISVERDDMQAVNVWKRRTELLLNLNVESVLSNMKLTIIELKHLKFFRNLFINESMFNENNQLA